MGFHGEDGDGDAGSVRRFRMEVEDDGVVKGRWWKFGGKGTGA